MRNRTKKIKGIIVHCSASDRYAEDDIENVRELHTSIVPIPWNNKYTKGKGWDDVGYNFYITFNGDLQLGRSLKYSGAHARGYNDSHIGICLSGLNHVANEAQLKTLSWLITTLRIQYTMLWKDIIPHNAVNRGKTCPNFDFYKLRETLKEAK